MSLIAFHKCASRVTCALPALVVSTNAFGQTLFVNASATGNNDGSSWANGYNSLQGALAAANVRNTDSNPDNDITEVWVAAGTYMSDGGYRATGGAHMPGTGNRTATFQLLNGVALYGGFAGGEAVLDQCDTAANPTILSGDVGGNDGRVPCTQNSLDCDSYGRLCNEGFCIISANNAENGYHVVTGSGTDATAVIDGFTITTGNADGSLGTGTDRGGGMYNYSGSPTLANCTFDGNSANISGGGIANVVNSRPTVANCMFSGNSSSDGGAMSNFRSSPMVTNCGFTRNSAGNGGGVYDDNASPTMIQCSFSGNSANSGGGMYNGSSAPTMSKCTFNENSAGNFGGAMYNNISTATVANSAFIGNQADTGGGMYNWVSSSTVTDTTFSANSAGGGGGGMANIGGRPTVTDCTFESNSATGNVGYGGGIYNNGSGLIVRRCTFTGNVANNGGAMFNDFSIPTVSNCAFSANSGRSGGGMLNIYWSSPRVTNCVFVGNSATAGSAGGMLNSSHSSPRVTNCTFIGNAADLGGGGMSAIFDSNPTVSNCTFWENSAAQGGGLESFNNSNPIVGNCILWGNTDSSGTGESAQVHTAGGAPMITYSIVQGGWSGAGGIGVLDAHPVFVDPDGPDGIPGTEDDNLRLMPSSPAISAGNNDALPPDLADLDGDGDNSEPTPTDLDGHARILCGVVDMGAYEFGVGDLNCDQIVDLNDFSEWVNCLRGPGSGPYDPGCEAFDIEFDGDVDLHDFARFQRTFAP